MRRAKDKEMRLAGWQLYRDLGKRRSYDRVIDALVDRFGHLPRSRVVRWAKEDEWVDRAHEHDTGVDVDATDDPIATDAQFDRTDLLLRAANLALTRALRMRPKATSAQDFKSLVDASEKAIRCVERLRELGVDHGQPGEADAQIRSAGQLYRTMLEAVRARHAAEGRPIMELVIDAAGNKVEQPRDKEGYLVNEHGQRLIDLTPTAITLPRAEPVVVMVDKSSNAVMVDKSSSGDTKVDTKGLTMAERLARLKR
jgi:hypothetical protein